MGRGASRAIIWTGAADRARAPCTHRFNRHAIPLLCTGDLLLSDVYARRQTPPLADVRAASTTRCMLLVLLQAEAGARRADRASRREEWRDRAF